MMCEHNLTTLDVVGRRIHPFEAMLIDACLRRDMLVRMCTCGYVCAGNTLDEVRAVHTSHLEAVTV